jgi:broad specificity phosphatase PhoE
MLGQALYRASQLGDCKKLDNLALVHAVLDVETNSITYAEKVSDMSHLQSILTTPPTGAIRRLILMRHAESMNNALKSLHFTDAMAAQAKLPPKQRYVDSQVLKDAPMLMQRTQQIAQVLNAHGDRLHFFVSPMQRTMQTFLSVACGMAARAPVTVVPELQEVRKTMSDDRLPDPAVAMQNVCAWTADCGDSSACDKDSCAAGACGDWKRALQTSLLASSPVARECDKGNVQGPCDELGADESTMGTMLGGAAREASSSVVARAKTALETIAARTGNERHAFVVAHGGIIRALCGLQ